MWGLVQLDRSHSHKAGAAGTRGVCTETENTQKSCWVNQNNKGWGKKKKRGEKLEKAELWDGK